MDLPSSESVVAGLVQCLGSHADETLGVASDSLMRHDLRVNSIFLPPSFSTPFMKQSLSPPYRSCIVNRLGSTVLRIDGLWFSVMGSVRCRM